MRRNHLVFGALWAALVALVRPAPALEAFDGQVELHGFYEAQIRSIVRDFDFSNDWDLTQWYNVVNLELEADLAPEGYGPFEVALLFVRIEARYDCVWTEACTLFDSADAYRIGHRRRIPKRLIDARRTGFRHTNFVADRRHYPETPLDEVRPTGDESRRRPDGSRVPMEFWQTPLGNPFFNPNSYGVDEAPGTADDPPFTYFEKILKRDCNEWGARTRPNGSEDGRHPGDTLILNPGCDFEPIGAASDKPNPFSTKDFNPLIGGFGSAALPYRPAPDLRHDSLAPLAGTQARGVYYPNERLQQLIRDGDLDPITNKLRRADLAWNRGDSQQDQKELKEIYLDLEFLESRLWLRLGYQTIVWGKTELFRNQDQFNPQDLALGSLTSLEESRISLWAIRAVWSFYEVGPLSDVRLEIAVNYDSYQRNDLGLCGEPYTVLAACALSTGQIAHGYYGVGLAGAVLPPAAWNSWKGIEAGARLEFRWDRFAFAITDFYGYQDMPYVDHLFTYSRNVDPRTGRPRPGTSTGSCRTGRERGCLQSEDALAQHHANQQLFALVCATTLAVQPDLDPTACLANVFGSPNRTGPPGELMPRVVVALDMIGSGDGAGAEGIVLPGLAEFTPETTEAIAQNTFDGRRKLTVLLNKDSNDGPVDHPANHPLVAEPDFLNTVAFFQFNLNGSISDKLTDEQEALLGCGAFFETSCDLDGLDLLNAEAGAVFQSFPVIAGTFVRDGRWDTMDASVAQPGTVGFDGALACTRYEGGKTYILPGCRGPGDAGYDPRVDGTTTGLVHPLTGQQFRNELAALSWNFVVGTVGLSLAPRPLGETEGPRNPARVQDFDPSQPFRQEGCSFREPQWCSIILDLLDLSGQRRNSVRAGGNGRYGRRDFVWHSGGVGVARVDKTNVLGFSLDFAEDATKSNWGVEFTWVNNVHVGNFNEEDGTSLADFYRLTISVDRPTFVNFLNANRTFFINSQWFFQYTENYRLGFSSDGPWDIFGVVSINTGYMRDRLLPALTLVYFVNNNSFAVLPQVTYRFTSDFSATVGIAAFAGREQERPMPIDGLEPAHPRFGRNAYKASVENGLALIRDRDEIFLRIKYSF